MHTYVFARTQEPCQTHPPLSLWSIFSGLTPSSPLSGPAASTSQACAGSRAPCPTLPLHPDSPEKQTCPWLGLKLWVWPSPAPPHPKPPGLACQRLGSGQTPAVLPHPSDNTAAEASGVPGRPWPRGPAAGGHPEEGWQPAGVQLGAWVRLSVPELSPTDAERRGVGGWDRSSGLRGGLEVSRALRTHGISSRLDGHQQGRCHGAFSSHRCSLLVFRCSRTFSEAPGLQEAPVAGRPPAPTADLPTQPPSTCVAPSLQRRGPPSFPRPSLPLGSPLPSAQPSPGDTCPLGPPVAPCPDDAASSSRCCPCLRRRGLLRAALPPCRSGSHDTPSLNLPSERPEQTWAHFPSG